MSILQQEPSDVYIQEINLSQVITSASTSVVGQIVVSTQGPVYPVQYTNAQDYLTAYGNPNAQVSFDVYCALDYFKQGNNLWALRVVGAGALWAADLLYVNASGATVLIPVTGGVSNVTEPDWAAITPVGGTAIALFYGNYGPGSYADTIGISIQSTNAEAPTNLIANSSSTGGTLPSATYEYQISSVGSEGETLATNPVTVVIAGSVVTNSITLSWTPDPNANGYNIYGRVVGSGFGFITTVGTSAGNTFTDTGGVVPNTAQQPITSPAKAPLVNPLFGVSVYNTAVSSTYAAETFDCSLLDNTDASGLETELEQRINPFSQYINVTSNVPALETIPEVGNSSIAIMTGGDSGAAPTEFDVAAAWSTFSNKQLYAVNILLNSGHSDPTNQQTMDALAQSRGDCVTLLDTPSAQQQFQQAVDYRNLQLNLNSTYSALFCPDQLESDLINGKQQYVPFSGLASALCALTDRVANPAFSIAGLNRGIVPVLQSRYTYDEGQATALFQAQVNYTRTFTGQGIALWEQQTLAAQYSALSWLSVRRIVNVVKVSLYKFLLYSVQEPNDDFTGRQIVSSCSAYLQAIQNARGISSFSVISDSSNNTPTMENSGIRTVTAIIVPLIPIHVINLQVVISQQGVSFQEVLSQVASQG